MNVTIKLLDKIILLKTHEGIKYPSDECDYQATRQGHLKTHKQSVHEGIKYPCDESDSIATHQGHLKQGWEKTRVFHQKPSLVGLTGLNRVLMGFMD